MNLSIYSCGGWWFIMPLDHNALGHCRFLDYLVRNGEFKRIITTTEEGNTEVCYKTRREAIAIAKKFIPHAKIFGLYV